MSKRLVPNRLPKGVRIALLMLLVVPGLHGAHDICISRFDVVTGLPDISDGFISGDKAGDGYIVADEGWTRAARLNLGVATGVENSAVVRLLQDDQFVYFGLLAIGFDNGNNFDTIVLGFRPDTTAANDVRIHIQPFGPGGVTNATSAGKPRDVSAWRNSAGWTSQSVPQPGSSNEHWLYKNSRIWKSESTTDHRWSLELKIPRASTASANLQDGIFFDTDYTQAKFKVYVNVLRTNIGAIDSTVVQSSWPKSVGLPTGALVSTPPGSPTGTPPVPPAQPAPSSWADGSVNDTNQATPPRSDCRGVYFMDPAGLGDFYSIGVWSQNQLTTDVRLHRPNNAAITLAQCDPPTGQENQANTSNEFRAALQNTLPADANNVRVQYFVKDYGIPPADIKHWRPLSATNNYSAAASVTAGTANQAAFPKSWAPTYKESCDVIRNTPSWAEGRWHTCLAALADSSDPATRFLTDSVRTNIDFVNASTFERSAVISAVGYGSPPGGRARHEFLIAVDANARWLDQKRRDNERRVAERDIVRGQMQKGATVLTWTARGYLKTGRYIEIHNKRFEIADEIGGFSYVALHNGPALSWGQSLSGGGIQHIAGASPNTYTISIEPDKEAAVVTKLQTVDLPKAPRCGRLRLPAILPITIGLVGIWAYRRPRGHTDGASRER